MEKLEHIITAIKDIDKELDAYEFNGYSFEEYQKYKKENKKGYKSLRHLKHNNSYIWNSWMQEALDKSKAFANKIFLYEKKKYNITLIDIEDINKLCNRLKESQSSFYKNTDKYSIYPIQSESIGNNLTLLSNLFNDITILLRNKSK